MTNFKPCQVRNGFFCRWIFTETTFIKCVDKKELDITLLAAEHGLTPSVISWEDKGDHFDIILEKYDRSLDYEARENLAPHQEQIEKLVRKLHEIGVYHGDLSEDNIVVKNGVVKLIDFGCSCFLAEISPKQFYQSMYKKKATCVDELLQAEYDYIARFCSA